MNSQEQISRENKKKRKFTDLISQDSKIDFELTFKEIKAKMFKKIQ